MTSTLKPEGIILKATPMFEHDKMLIFFSPELGKCRILAKSVLSSRTKMAGSFEPTCHVVLTLFKGKTFLQTRYADMISPFWKIRESLDKLNVAFYCLNILVQATPMDHPNPPLFDLLLTTLSQLNDLSQEHSEAIKHRFQRTFLTLEGLLETDAPVTDDLFKSHLEAYCGRLLSYRNL